jgi:uncharacterized membrane protein (UPF0127 family)
VGDRLYQVELADSQKERQQGLSNHQPLSADAGMYFVFENGGIYPFWMKDMLFDIDIVWIKDNKVIGVSQGDHKNPEKRIYPPSEVDRVLEVNINSGIKVGDSVNLR